MASKRALIADKQKKGLFPQLFDQKVQFYDEKLFSTGHQTNRKKMKKDLPSTPLDLLIPLLIKVSHAILKFLYDTVLFSKHLAILRHYFLVPSYRRSQYLTSTSLHKYEVNFFQRHFQSIRNVFLTSNQHLFCSLQTFTIFQIDLTP